MLTARQIKAARALAGMTAKELGASTGLTEDTINNIEGGRTQAREGSLERIAKALDAAGIKFTEDEGVKLKPNDIEIFEGKQRFGDFMAYLLADVKKFGGEVRASVTDERIFQQYIPNIESFRREMMELDRVGKIKGRILAVEGNFIRTWGDLRRAPSTSQIAPVSFYVFNDNFALVSFAHKNAPYVELHKSSLFAADFRRLFDMAWESAVQP